MIEMVDLFSAQQAAVGKPAIRIGVGIATGPVIAGYTGTMNRATYTCVGDTVNLAARLEAYTKTVGKPILINEATCQQLGDEFIVEECGPVELKGKTQAVNVFIVPVGQDITG
jgi:class 3 adenylate cyclase